jgi:hypothetical protein
MTLEVPTTGERVALRLVEDGSGALCLVEGRPERIGYVLKSVLEAGWRIVESTPAERALLESHGLNAKRQS